MTDTEKLAALREILSDAITWYKEAEDDDSATYDCSIEQLEGLSRGDAQMILSILSE